jgi:hypothetical protein
MVIAHHSGISLDSGDTRSGGTEVIQNYDHAYVMDNSKKA